MIASQTELFVQRRNTAAFIAADPEEIVLTPRVQERTSTGGFKWVEQPPRAVQTFKIIERNTSAATITRVVGGEQHEVELTLLGHWDAVVGAHDIFEHRGARWEVLSVDHFNGYEQRAQVIRYGR